MPSRPSTTRKSGVQSYLIRDGGLTLAPDYSRVVAVLTTRDLELEISAGLGGGDYQKAVRDELDRRKGTQ